MVTSETLSRAQSLRPGKAIFEKKRAAALVIAALGTRTLRNSHMNSSVEFLEETFGG